MRYCISRPVDGITINTEKEYLLDDEGRVMCFSTRMEAEYFLESHGIDRDVVDIEEVEEEDQA